MQVIDYGTAKVTRLSIVSSDENQSAAVDICGDEGFVRQIIERIENPKPNKIQAVRILREFLDPIVAKANKPSLLELKHLVEKMGL